MTTPPIKKTITFRQFTAADIPLMHRWLNNPQVALWYKEGGTGYPSFEYVKEKWTRKIQGKARGEPFLMQCQNTTIGYIQRDMKEQPEEIQRHAMNAHFASIDLCIGEDEYRHQGLGAVIILEFLREYVFNFYKVDICVIDPEPDNKIAIRAYEKAGFRYYTIIWNPVEKVHAYLMKVERNTVCPP